MNWRDAYERYIKSVFPRLRPAQSEILSRIPPPEQADLVVISAPPGVGKSLIGLILGVSHPFPSRTVSKLVPRGPHVHIVTPTKGLQDQYRADLEKISQANGWKYTVLKGRQNYPCPIYSRRTAATCPLLDVYLPGGRRFCSLKPRRIFKHPNTSDYVQTYAGDYLIPPGGDWCPYWRDKYEAMRSNFAVFNYHYYFYESFYVGDFVPPLVLVFDEVHTVFDVLDSIFGVSIYPSTLGRFGVSVPPTSSPHVFASNIIAGLQDRQVDIERTLSSLTYEDFEDPDIRRMAYSLVSAWRSIFELRAKLSYYVRNREYYYARVKPFARGYALHIRPYPYLIAPILAHFFGVSGGEASFFRVSQVIAMSATPGSQGFWRRVANTLGIGMSYIDYPESPFPVQRRLIFFPTDAPRVTETALKRELGSIYDVAVKDGVSPRAVARSSIVQSQVALIARLYNMFGRVVVHTWNNKIAALVSVLLEHMGVPVEHPVYRPTEAVLEWMNSDSESVLVTYSVREGIDLAYDKARVQVILKLPIPNLRDPYISAIRRLIPEYYRYRIMATLVQQSGRVCRARDDWGYTIVYDSVARDWFLRNSPLFPRYFVRAAVTSMTTKQVLRFLADRIVEYSSVSV